MINSTTGLQRFQQFEKSPQMDPFKRQPAITVDRAHRPLAASSEDNQSVSPNL